MAGDCDNRNSITRPGVSRYTRVLKALMPSFARVDEHTPADLILFAKEYARYLNYYNDKAPQTTEGQLLPDGDWQNLMKMDVSVALATLSKFRAQESFAYIDRLLNNIQSANVADVNTIKSNYRSIFDFLYSTAFWLNTELTHLPPQFGFTVYLSNILTSRLGELFWRVKEYYQQSDAALLIAHDLFSIPEEAPADISPVEYWQLYTLEELWNFVPPTPFTMPVEGTTDTEKIRYIAQHAIFKGTVEQFIKTLSNVSAQAGEWLNKTLNAYPSHTPHYALYLTFIKLFRYAQDHLNEYTRNHLDFYYKEVLRLLKQPAKPGFVHLLIELAKQTDTHLLAKGTAFKAGKDEDKMERFYISSDDVVINKGAVKSIKNVFSVNEGGNRRVYASPVANSGDGQGGDLTTADKSWKPFGLPLAGNLANTGFAVSHSILFMKEGARFLIVAIECDQVAPVAGKDISTWFTVRYTSTKGWEPATISLTYVSPFENKLYFLVSVPVDKPAVDPYNEKVHLAGYTTVLPVMEFLVNVNVVNHNPHEWMKDIAVKKIDLVVLVAGLKDVGVQNELSVLDAAKPFEMFGPQPHIGSSFIIGSKEIFLKNRKAAVTALLNIEWDKVDKLAVTSNDYPNFTNKKIFVKYLENGIWKTNTANGYHTQPIFNHIHTPVDGTNYHVPLTNALVLSLPQFSNEFDFSPNIPFDIHSRSGFVKVEFAGKNDLTKGGTMDFGHSDYVYRLTYATLNDKTNIPAEPYAPAVKSLTLNYFASTSFSVQGSSLPGEEDGHFYHLLPFGHTEQHAAISGSPVSLLPGFNNEGEIYIGIENFRPGQSLQVLFQVSDGSANPLKDRQDITWYYLSYNNQWQLFDEKSISDASNDLTVSGIIKFGFPEDATDINTAFNEKLFWIRGIVASNSDACCDINALHAQAIKAQFDDYKRAGNYYKGVLAAENISKLVNADSAIKKIQQPYASFGGRIKEVDEEFYIRVSERLRHKNRGITIWDYERIVLQNFTEIYKVKCLNHTRVKLVGSVEQDNELLPGHVVVVPVPDLRQKNAVNPLKPMTSIGTLNSIEEYLKQYISPFVKLQVKNPRFEEIQLDFRVKFNNDDGAYYHDVLTREIEEYLSPWAFDSSAEISFGGKVYKSVLIDFVEERSYVDFVTCFKMFHYVDGIRSADIDEIVATSARTVLVSFGGTPTNPKHIIDYSNHGCNCT